MSDTADKIKRLIHLDGICAGLEAAMLQGRGDVKAMRVEWRACQDEIAGLEKELEEANTVFLDDSGWGEK